MHSYNITLYKLILIFVKLEAHIHSFESRIATMRLALLTVVKFIKN